jgi:uncharacterized protein
MALADESFVLLTTFRRDGRAVSTPVWWVELGDNNYGFWTSSESGKVKRLAHTPRVTVQPCNGRGAVKKGSSVSEGTARVVSGAEFEELRQKVVAKYGSWTKVTKFLAQLGGLMRGKRLPYGDRGVIVTL